MARFRPRKTVIVVLTQFVVCWFYFNYNGQSGTDVELREARVHPLQLVKREREAHRPTVPLVRPRRIQSLKNATHPPEFVPTDLMPDVIAEFPDILINPANKLCRRDKNGEIYLLIMILTSLRNVQKRNFVRATYGKVKKHNGHSIRHVFLLGEGVSYEAEAFKRLLRNESRKYGDIAQFAFADLYKNLSLKTSCGLMWSHKFCPARFVMKTDDDVVVYPERIVDFLQKLNPTEEHNLYSGSTHLGVVVRNSRSRKYYVSYDVWPYVKYPDYNRGLGILMSRWVVKRFYMAAWKIVRVPSEDAYLGILARAIGIYPTCNRGIGLFYGWDMLLKLTDPRQIFCYHWPLLVAMYWPKSARIKDWESYLHFKNKDATSICNKTEMYDNDYCNPYLHSLDVRIYPFRYGGKQGY